MFEQFALMAHLSITCPKPQNNRYRPEELWQNQVPNTSLQHYFFDDEKKLYERVISPFRITRPYFHSITLSRGYLAGLREEERFNEIARLNENWDGYGAIAPTKYIINRSKEILKNIQPYFREKLDTEYIFPNPNGTISIEWRNNQNVISIEVGNSSSNFYSIVNGENTIEENITEKLPDSLAASLAAFFTIK